MEEFKITSLGKEYLRSVKLRNLPSEEWKKFWILTDLLSNGDSSSSLSDIISYEEHYSDRSKGTFVPIDQIETILRRLYEEGYIELA